METYRPFVGDYATTTPVSESDLAAQKEALRQEGCMMGTLPAFAPHCHHHDRQEAIFEAFNDCCSLERHEPTRRRGISVRVNGVQLIDPVITVRWFGEVHPEDCGFWRVSGRCDRLSSRTELASPVAAIDGYEARVIYASHATIQADDGYISPAVAAACKVMGTEAKMRVGDIYMFDGLGEFPFTREQWTKLCLERLNAPTADPIDRVRVDRVLTRARAAGFVVARFAHQQGVEFVARRGAERAIVLGRDDNLAAQNLADRLGFGW